MEDLLRNKLVKVLCLPSGSCIGYGSRYVSLSPDESIEGQMLILKALIKEYELGGWVIEISNPLKRFDLTSERGTTVLAVSIAY